MLWLQALAAAVATAAVEVTARSCCCCCSRRRPRDGRPFRRRRRRRKRGQQQCSNTVVSIRRSTQTEVVCRHRCNAMHCYSKQAAGRRPSEGCAQVLRIKNRLDPAHDAAPTAGFRSRRPAARALARCSTAAYSRVRAREQASELHCTHARARARTHAPSRSHASANCVRDTRPCALLLFLARSTDAGHRSVARSMPSTG